MTSEQILSIVAGRSGLIGGVPLSECVLCRFECGESYTDAWLSEASVRGGGWYIRAGSRVLHVISESDLDHPLTVNWGRSNNR